MFFFIAHLQERNNTEMLQVVAKTFAIAGPEEAASTYISVSENPQLSFVVTPTE
jgi:hypothetical protein